MSPLSATYTEVESIDVITYPCSEWGRGLREAGAATRYLAQRGAQVRQLRGRSFDHSIDLLHERLSGPHRPDAVVCVGGDDLITVTLQATAPTGTPLGVIPTGPTDELATALGIPRTDPHAAAEIVLAGAVRSIDLGLIESPTATCALTPPRWFATTVHAGLDTAGTSRGRRRWLHPDRVRLASPAEVRNRTPRPFRLEISRARDVSTWQVVETEAWSVAVSTPTLDAATSGRSGPGEAGLLEVTVIGAMPSREAARVLADLTARRPLSHPGVTRYRTAGLTLCTPGIRLVADATTSTESPVAIRAVAAAQRVLAP